MKIKRRQLLRNSIASLLGFQLAHLGIKPSISSEQPITIAQNDDTPQGAIGLIPSELSEKFFQKVLYPDLSFRNCYDYFVNQGFSFETSSIIGLDSQSKDFPFLLLMLSGTNYLEDKNTSEHIIIPLLYIDTKVLVLDTPSVIYDIEPFQFQSFGIYSTMNKKLSYKHFFDQKMLKEESKDELKEQLIEKLNKAVIAVENNKQNEIIDKFPDLTIEQLRGVFNLLILQVGGFSESLVEKFEYFEENERKFLRKINSLVMILYKTYDKKYKDEIEENDSKTLNLKNSKFLPNKSNNTYSPFQKKSYFLSVEPVTLTALALILFALALLLLGLACFLAFLNIFNSKGQKENRDELNKVLLQINTVQNEAQKNGIILPPMPQFECRC
jgi:hypothetical protein